MRAAYVDDRGVCYRIEIVADLCFAPGALDGTFASVGDRWDGTQWVRPVLKRPVPEEVTMRQARRALYAAGLLSTVDAAINALPEPQRTAAKIDWEYSNSVRRDNPTLLAIASSLGLTDDDIDNLMISAASFD